MIYGSVCSGIEAATVAWHPLGWRPSFFSEIDKFPRAVLQHHYPEVPLHGDFTTIEAGQYRTIDLLVGGTPCQSFSIAGLRGGLGDDRGNLALGFLRLADRLRPRWLVWENVPGVLSSKGGRDFGSILGGMAELGYGFAYRVLDAQYIRTLPFPRAVPQRRRRVFVVGYLGDWRRAAAVLFERESLCRHPAPRREAGQGSPVRIARSLAIRGRDGTPQIEMGDDCANAILTPNGGRAGIGIGAALVSPTISARPSGGGGLGTDFDLDGGLICAGVASALRAEGFDASEDGTGRGTPIIAFSSKDYGADATAGCAPTLRAMGHTGSHPNAGGQVAIAIQEAATRENPNAGPDGAGFRTDGAAHTVPQAIATGWRVRRLMPVECERLQGFPDGYTDIPWRGKDTAPDGPRYKALGNSMAVNVMRWIGDRIAMVDAL